MVRINKFLANCEQGSRRSVEKLILDGRVTINDKLCTELSTKINPSTDIVKIDGVKTEPSTQKIFVMLNKPIGYVVSRNDEFGRKTVYSLLPEFAKNLHPIGRLDRDTEGLLLLTNEGDITNKITHPSFEIEKTYKIIVKNKIAHEDIIKLREGIKIENYTTMPARVFLKHSDEEKSELRITITEGKNRQVRKMLETLGYQVLSLKRLQIGRLKLEKLPVGMWRFLKDHEVLYLLKLHHTPNTNKNKVKDKHL